MNTEKTEELLNKTPQKEKIFLKILLLFLIFILIADCSYLIYMYPLKFTATEKNTEGKIVSFQGQDGYNAAIKNNGSLWISYMTPERYSGIEIIDPERRTEKFMNGVDHFVGDNAVIKKDGSLWMWCNRNILQDNPKATLKEMKPAEKVTDNVKTIYYKGDGKVKVLTDDGTLFEINDPFYEEDINYEKTVLKENVIEANKYLAITKDKLLWSTESEKTNEPILSECKKLSENGGTNYVIKEDESLWDLNNGSPFQVMTGVEKVYDDQIALALKKDKSLWLLGNYNKGGFISEDNKEEPKKILDNVVAADVVQYHTMITGSYVYSALALTENGDLYTWGFQGINALEEKESVDVPKKFLSDVKSFKIGFNGSGFLALKNNGTLWTWDMIEKLTNPQIIMENVVNYDLYSVVKSDGSYWTIDGEEILPKGSIGTRDVLVKCIIIGIIDLGLIVICFIILTKKGKNYEHRKNRRIIRIKRTR